MPQSINHLTGQIFNIFEILIFICNTEADVGNSINGYTNGAERAKIANNITAKDKHVDDTYLKGRLHLHKTTIVNVWIFLSDC